MPRPPLLQSVNARWVGSLHLVLALAFAARLPAATVITGDVTPALPWSASAQPRIGITGAGTLAVDGGSQLSANSGYLGYSSSSTGSATISGVGSTWTNSNSLFVGFAGNGGLRVESGGQVSNVVGYLGYDAGSTGAATITGAGSNWTASSALHVGRAGSGSLTVEDEAHVTAGTLYASLSDLHGNGTIAATTGAVLDADLQFNAAHPAQAVLGFGAGGTLTVTAANGGFLGAGYHGVGTLTIAEGVTVSSDTGYLGYRSGSTGTAKVTGAGSKWVNSSFLYVGRSGDSELRVEAGAQVSSATSALGDLPGSTGTAIVTGAGSNWTSSTSLYVGYFGNGSLTVEDGGHVAAATLYASLEDLHGDGTIAATGAVLDADLQFNASQATQTDVGFGSAGTLTVTPTGGDLGAGYKGMGKSDHCRGRGSLQLVRLLGL